MYGFPSNIIYGVASSSQGGPRGGRFKTFQELYSGSYEPIDLYRATGPNLLTFHPSTYLYQGKPLYFVPKGPGIDREKLDRAYIDFKTFHVVGTHGDGNEAAFTISAPEEEGGRPVVKPNRDALQFAHDVRFIQTRFGEVASVLVYSWGFQPRYKSRKSILGKLRPKGSPKWDNVLRGMPVDVTGYNQRTQETQEARRLRDRAIVDLRQRLEQTRQLVLSNSQGTSILALRVNGNGAVETRINDVLATAH